jgi:uncharacterized iron-regulated membrane protein
MIAMRFIVCPLNVLPDRGGLANGAQAPAFPLGRRSAAWQGALCGPYCSRIEWGSEMYSWIVWAHKWLGLIVGVQLILWVASGLFMTAIPIETVRGEHNIRKSNAVPLPVEGLPALSAVLKGPATRAELILLNDAPVWRIDREGQADRLVDARTGAVLSPLDATAVMAIAKSDFAGTGGVKGVALISENPHIEYRGALPVWQVQFADAEATRIYVSPLTGKVVARRTSTWRVYDFLWSLHIMDYRGRDDFNHPLVVIASALGLILSLTGLWIVAVRFWPRRY